MNIRGRERRFLLTVRGRDEIAKLCPNQDIKEIGQAMQMATTTDFMQKIMLIMSRDYEDHMKYHDQSYDPDYLTENDLAMLTMEEFRQLDEEVSNAFLSGMGITVETEDVKTKGKKTKGSGEK